MAKPDPHPKTSNPIWLKLIWVNFNAKGKQLIPLQIGYFASFSALELLSPNAHINSKLESPTPSLSFSCHQTWPWFCLWHCICICLCILVSSSSCHFLHNWGCQQMHVSTPTASLSFSCQSNPSWASVTLKTTPDTTKRTKMQPTLLSTKTIRFRVQPLQRPLTKLQSLCHQSKHLPLFNNIMRLGSRIKVDAGDFWLKKQKKEEKKENCKQD